MQIPVSSRIRMYIPVWPPFGTDPTIYPVEIGLSADLGKEPIDAAYHPAQWATRRVSVVPAVWEAWMMVGPGGGIVYATGEYMAWVRIDVGPLDERPVLKSGRVRFGEVP
jgi:hypothetical protein